ncbi:hypothetical protein CFP65_0821 [Kitasatospora sp. MMS16-BH015]|uniref:response regulator receiver domain n=1 Tax=Kitasatospora sp. MMS16-BH015 TaxID=2018025 RepID=UPI000CA3D419|nr:response regulator receiver domain [Kitasatospora sp. MMS16-BH015]AUG75757.1 hypothetical protein CFP65_0821 [Kitasatospora sp. MMS16-BH015]
MTFSKESEQVALQYLQTVVVIDDGLLLGVEDASGEAEVVDPVDPLEVDPAEGEGETKTQGSAGQDLDGAPDDLLRGEQLIRGFAEKGLVCGLLKPSSGQELEDIKSGQYQRLFARADVMVLDWSLARDEGATTRKLILDLVGKSEERVKRLRLICIYTNSPNLASIQESIALDLRADGINSFVGGEMERDWFVQGGDFRIAILGKTGVSRLPHFSEAEVPEGELPSRIVTEFTRLAHGLMPALALNSLAILRDNAPMLLQRFNGNLDPAFVSHELLTGQGRRFAVQLISREIQSILEAADAGSVLSHQNVKAWAATKLEAVSSDELEVKMGNSRRKFKKLDVLTAISQEEFSLQTFRELKTTDGLKLGAAKLASLSSLFSPDPDALDSDEQLGLLSCLSRDLHGRYDGTRMPTLQLGSIVAQREQDSSGEVRYWLCLQALCDSERVTGPRGFPLIPLRPASNGAEFDFLIMDHSGVRVQLSGSSRPFEMKVVEFSPEQGDDVIRATRRDGELVFQDCGHGSWYWVAELRPEHALRVSHQMASQISRIGLDESEWLRLSGNNKKS